MTIHFDKTLSPSMDAKQRLQISDKYKELVGKTHFDNHELKCMLLFYEKLAENKVLKKKAFIESLRMLGVKEDQVLERLYCTIESPSANGIMYDQFVCLLSLYCRGSLEERIVFAFMMIDESEKGHITKETAEALLRDHLGVQNGIVTDEQNRNYVNAVFKFFDKDEDELIGFEDFKATVTNSPPMINCFGRFFPEQSIMDVFLTTFTRHVGPKYSNATNEKSTDRKRKVKIEKKYK